MASLFQELTPEYRRLFEDLMAFRDADGSLLRTAAEVACDLLKNFVTQHGKLNSDNVDRLGGQARFGRSDILLDLIRCLTGPDPVPQAWLDAQRTGSFDLFKPAFYRPKFKKGAQREASDREIGSPGVFLQRMVAQYRSDSNSRRTPPGSDIALYSEAAMLTAVVIIRNLQKAVCAGAALGTAWVINKAVDPLPASVKRRMDALAGDEVYLKALGAAIEQATVTHVAPDLKERSNDEVARSLPAGEDVGAYFAAREERLREEVVEELVAALQARAVGSGKKDLPGHLGDAIERVLKVARTVPLDYAEIDARAKAATAYLEEPVTSSPSEITDHHTRLRFLMPLLSASYSSYERTARLLYTANFYSSNDISSPSFFADMNADLVKFLILQTLRGYVLHVGPPPPAVPTAHLVYFELIANAMYIGNVGYWPARDQWKAAGLLPSGHEPTEDLKALLSAFSSRGLRCLIPGSLPKHP